MVDFGKLLMQEGGVKPTEPRELFASLVREERFQYLRDVQASTLEEWYRSRTAKDIVLKMNTGSGKTIVGLLMLQSSLNEGVGPALYLCPTVQLVHQVVSQAKDIGVPVVEFPDDSNLIPIDFRNSEAILVATASRLFNGRSVFGVVGQRDPVEIGSLLIDDAHTCLSHARESVTIELTKGSTPYRELLSLFQESLYSISPATAACITNGDPTAWLPVSYWHWQNAIRDVARILAEHSDCDDLRQLKFAWPLLKDELVGSTCIISGNKIEIAPWTVPVHQLPSFGMAKRRFFLSATLADDSVLVRDFGIDIKAVSSPICPPLLGDSGERMIIAPALIDPALDRESVATLAKKVAESGYNVVILVPSWKYAEFWKKQGAAVAEGRTLDLLQNLQTSKQNFLVLVNRYDGIDLPGDQCRVLILDGLPQAGSFYDHYLNTCLPTSRITKAAIAQRLEQGMGRGVRSGNDYCVVLVVNNNIVEMLTVKQNQKLFTPEMRRQLEIESVLRKAAVSEGQKPYDVLRSLMWQCLSQDKNWKAYHRSRMRDFDKPESLDLPRSLAVGEYRAMSAWRQGDPTEAVKALEDTMQNVSALLQPEDKGWYLQLQGALIHKSDPIKAQELQRKAHQLNTALLRPIEGIRYQKLVAKTGAQAARVNDWLGEHTDSNALVLSVDALISKLAFGVDADGFESSLAELGRLLGFEAHRPEKEYGKGPDVLWAMADGHYFVIEAKNEVLTSRGFISKSEASQLSNSANWFQDEYPPGTAMTPILVHPAKKCANDAYPPNETMVIGQEELSMFLSKVHNFFLALSKRAPDAWRVEDVSALLVGHDLTPSQIRERFVTRL